MGNSLIKDTLILSQSFASNVMAIIVDKILDIMVLQNDSEKVLFKFIKLPIILEISIHPRILTMAKHFISLVNSDKLAIAPKFSRPGPSSSFTSNWPQAHFTSHNNYWLVDSGAFHHITSDIQNLSIHSEYDGNEDIM
ncbi:hypothetical protein PanWU01x14_011340, partial [Parasponia andersonii]